VPLATGTRGERAVVRSNIIAIAAVLSLLASVLVVAAIGVVSEPSGQHSSPDFIAASVPASK
jgi:hypothetical protein